MASPSYIKAHKRMRGRYLAARHQANRKPARLGRPPGSRNKPRATPQPIPVTLCGPFSVWTRKAA